MKRDIAKEQKSAFEKKASIAYVDQQDKSLHHRIDEVKCENDNIEKKIDENQKFIIERLEVMNNNIMSLHK
jgi:hypothetical protein